jgi:predicted lipoprotein with Yx(FWY)xxD motif
MKFYRLVATFLALFVFGVACAPAPISSPTPVETPFIPITGSTALEPSADPQPVRTAVAPKNLATATIVHKLLLETPTQIVRPDMTVTVNREGAGSFLSDKQGRSLYVYMNDSQNGNASACVDDCAVDWPPLVVSTTPEAGAGVKVSLLGTILRDDGSLQATYNGWPLYYYNMDTIPGTTNGPSVSGLWHLISPSGKPVP